MHLRIADGKRVPGSYSENKYEYSHSWTLDHGDHRRTKNCQSIEIDDGDVKRRRSQHQVDDIRAK